VLINQKILGGIMEKKKLLKCALTAFAVASVLPAAADLAEMNHAGTFLAAGCGGGGGHSCNQQRGNVSYNDSPRGYQADNYNPQTRSYEATAGNAGFSADRPNYSDANTNRGYNTSPGYSDNYRSYSSTEGDTDSMRSGATTKTMSEADFQKQLSSQGKAIYQSLDSEGKAMARQLASQDAYKDKDLAVKEAQRRSNEKRGMSGSSGMSGMNGSMNNERSSNWNR
jgi:hypothetical protein